MYKLQNIIDRSARIWSLGFDVSLELEAWTLGALMACLPLRLDFTNESCALDF